MVKKSRPVKQGRERGRGRALSFPAVAGFRLHGFGASMLPVARTCRFGDAKPHQASPAASA